MLVLAHFMKDRQLFLGGKKEKKRHRRLLSRKWRKESDSATLDFPLCLGWGTLRALLREAAAAAVDTIALAASLSPAVKSARGFWGRPARI